MRKHLFLLCLLSILTLPVSADGLLPDSLYYFSKLNPQLKKHPWKAGLETVMTNVGVWSFDRFVMNEEFARINIHTIRSNVKNGFVWDNDQFSTICLRIPIMAASTSTRRGRTDCRFGKVCLSPSPVR